MKTTIDTAGQFRDQFAQCGRKDQFSYEALGLLFDYLEEIDPDMELDVIAICCDYTENSADTIAQDYSIDLSAASDGVCTASAYGLEQVEAAKRDIVREYLMDEGAYVGETLTGFVYSSF
jgi:hypothetical protein